MNMLREQVRADPEAAFAEFTLSEAEKFALRRPDEMLSIIAQETVGVAVAAGSELQEQTPPVAAIPTPDPQFFLRIFPHLTSGPSGEIYVSYSGHLDPAALVGARDVPWRDRLQSTETLTAADAVKNADKQSRNQRILELIGTLVGP